MPVKEITCLYNSKIQKVRKTKINIKSNFVGVYMCTDALPIYADKNMPHEQVFFYLFLKDFSQNSVTYISLSIVVFVSLLRVHDNLC